MRVSRTRQGRAGGRCCAEHAQAGRQAMALHRRCPCFSDDHQASTGEQQPVRSGKSGQMLGGGLTGVATTISGLVRSVAACTFSDKPPTTSAVRMSVNCASFVIMECTCTATHSPLFARLLL